MKFAHKLSLTVLVLLSVVLSLMAYFTISNNFTVSLQNIAAGYTDQHLLQRYSLEADLLGQRKLGNEITGEYIARYGSTMVDYVQSKNHWLAMYTVEDEVQSRLYSNLPEYIPPLEAEIVQTGQQGYYVRQYGQQWLMLISSEVENAPTELWLVSAYDVTATFRERDRQINTMLYMQLAILVFAGVVVVFVCSRLTRPIRRLNVTSRKITSGVYSARSDVESDDEIGELAQNFNRMAGAVEEQIDQLNMSVQQREDFVSAFTHEVKTPMTAIIGYSDLLRSQEVNTETRQKAAHFIHRESKRLEGLSQKLLMLMGLSEEDVKLVPAPVNAILTDAARSVMPNLGDDYQLKIKPSEGTLVLAERDLVVDLIRNLILNALKAEPKDGIVRIGCIREGASARIYVADTGKGIPPEQLERIVEPFYMVDKSRARREGGSGVGLSLCQKIAELHGSALQFESEVGVGTTVYFNLQTPGL